MKLDQKQVARLEEFLAGIKAATYPEPASDLHDGITTQMLDRLWTRCTLPPGGRVRSGFSSPEESKSRTSTSMRAATSGPEARTIPFTG